MDGLDGLNNTATRWWTLDDIEDATGEGLLVVAARAIAMLIDNYTGVVVHGTSSAQVALFGQHDQGWGKPLELPSREKLYLRCSVPLSVLDGGEAQPRVLVATRTVNSQGATSHAIATLFRSPGGLRKGCVLLPTLLRPVACHGLHVIAVGLPRHHDPHLEQAFKAGRLSAAQMCRKYDDRACPVVQATTISVVRALNNETTARKLRRERARTKPSKSTSAPVSCAASAGNAVIVVALELLSHDGLTWMHANLSDTSGVVGQDVFESTRNAARASLCELGGGAERADVALLSAVAVLDLLSADSLVTLRAFPFFADALPDYLYLPDGLGLMVSVALRLAVHWHRYGLPKPDACDEAANDKQRMMARMSMPPLPHVREDRDALDLVLKTVIRQSTRSTGNKGGHITEALVFWQRIGQHIITSHFGMGAAPNTAPHPHFGDAWRFRHDIADRFGLALMLDGVP